MAPRAVSTVSRPTWVRSWDTKTDASKSAQELEALLRRYQASGMTVSNDYAGGTVVISFTIPRTWQVKGAEALEVKLTVSHGETQRRLEQLAAFQQKAQRQGSNRVTWAKAQSERVAWRHVVLLVTAALEAAASGIQTVEEAFFAHSVLPGTPHRVIDVVHQHRKQLTGGSA
jgi:hypothetical protein